MKELDKFLQKRVEKARAEGKTEDWIKGMVSAFNRYRSDKNKESAVGMEKVKGK